MRRRLQALFISIIEILCIVISAKKCKALSLFLKEIQNVINVIFISRNYF